MSKGPGPDVQGSETTFYDVRDAKLNSFSLYLVSWLLTSKPIMKLRKPRHVSGSTGAAAFEARARANCSAWAQALAAPAAEAAALLAAVIFGSGDRRRAWRHCLKNAGDSSPNVDQWSINAAVGI